MVATVQSARNQAGRPSSFARTHAPDWSHHGGPLRMLGVAAKRQNATRRRRVRKASISSTSVVYGPSTSKGGTRPRVDKVTPVSGSQSALQGEGNDVQHQPGATRVSFAASQPIDPTTWNSAEFIPRNVGAALG